MPAANSRLTHYRLQSESADSLHIGNLQIDQRRDSRVDSSQLMRGNVLRRNDIHVRHAGKRRRACHARCIYCP
jgi:hypothetical protein